MASRKTHPLNIVEIEIILTTIASTLMFMTLHESFKIVVAGSILLFGIFYLINKSVLFATYAMLFISGLFYFPIKRYEVELIAGGNFYYLDEFRNGLLGTYGLTTSDIYSLIILALMIARWLLTRHKGKNGKSLFQAPLIITSMILWIIYFLVSIASSIYISNFPTFSTVIAIQSTKMIVLFIATISLMGHGKKFKNRFYTLAIGILLAQGIYGIVSFLKFDISGISLSVYRSLEEQTLLQRVTAIIGHPNQDAYLTALLLSLTMPYIISEKKAIFTTSALIACINLFLFQSRTIWLAVLLCLLIAYWYFRKQIQLHFRFKTRYIYYISALIMLVSVLIIPRILLSRFFFSEGGGGTLRINMLEEGYRTLLESPIYGFGVQNTVVSIFRYFPRGYVKIFPVPVHFSPLELALESGIIAAACFLLPYYFYLRQAVLCLIKKKKYNVEVFSFMCSLVIILVYFSLQPLDNLRRDFVMFGILFGWGTTHLLRE